VCSFGSLVPGRIGTRYRPRIMILACSRHRGAGRNDVVRRWLRATLALAWVVVVLIDRRADAQTVSVCATDAWDASVVDAAIRAHLAEEVVALVGDVAFEVIDCSRDSAVLVARFPFATLRRSVRLDTGDASPDVAANRIVESFVVALETVLGNLATVRGVARPRTSEGADSLAASSVGRANGAAEADGQRASTVDRVSVSVPEDSPVPEPPDDPRAERVGFSLDAGVRLYQGSTGAYGFRFRTAWRILFIDYRFATISMNGLFVGDEARIFEQSAGVGVRRAFRFARRGAISLGAAFDFGLARATGRSRSGGLPHSAGTATADLRADVAIELCFRMFRVRLGVEAGYERGIVVWQQDDTFARRRLGGFDGAMLGLYAGVGFARPREEEPR